MGIRPDYKLYLQHFGSTQTVYDLYSQPDRANLIALRHDVDYNLDVALEMAWLEYEYGCRATYYLLHTQSYVADELFLEKCRQIQTLGHEIGLHNNLITQWIDQDINIAETLSTFLARLRSAGLKVTGVSTHGDRQCYVHRYLNSWCFHESRPTGSEPLVPLNAEGIPATKPDEALVPPPSGVLDVKGRCLPLWKLHLGDFGLRYEAHRLPLDQYFTDSGGQWRRSSDPLYQDLSRGRIQILIHPIWWAEPQRLFFFLSTARSGSKWLTNMLARTTTCEARHEFSLNHELVAGALVSQKHTAAGFAQLAQQPERAKQLLQHIRQWLDTLPGDYAEANVYLAHFLPELRELFPEATFIHLHRDGRAVVRSLLNRAWYDTPEDDRHPRFDRPGWDNLSQLEKACWYYRLTNEAIDSFASHRLSFERMTQDPAYLPAKLKEIGLRIVLPELAAQEHSRRINANYADDIPPLRQWPVEQQAIFHKICGDIQTRLGYSNGIFNEAIVFLGRAKRLFRRSFSNSTSSLKIGANSRPFLNSASQAGAAVLFEDDFAQFGRPTAPPYMAVRCDLTTTPAGLKITLPDERPFHAHVHYGRGRWRRPDPTFLFPVDPQVEYYRLEVELELSAGLAVGVHVLVYDQNINPIQTPYSRQVQVGDKTVTIPFGPRPGMQAFTFGFHFSKEAGGGTCLLRRVRILQVGR